MIIMIKKEFKAFVISAITVKRTLANKVMCTEFESEEFFDALREYNEFFFDFHSKLESLLMPLILDNDFEVSRKGCFLLEKTFNEFKEQRTVSEKIASKYCLEYSDIL